MVTNSLLYYFLALFLIQQSVFGVELTFDLPDSARDCFHEEIKKNTSVTLEYQVKRHFIRSDVGLAHIYSRFDNYLFISVFLIK